MHIDGPIPFALAQTYGTQHATHVAKAVVAAPVEQLIAGQVVGKTSFDSVTMPETQPLQLYTRCADRIEAATRIATGQHLNIQV